MKFDIWTILFQIVNFAVLLFVLQRLLYRPVREIIRKRRDMVEKTIRDAEEARDEARKLEEKYRKEMSGLDSLRVKTMEEMKAEVEQLRERLLAEARADAAKVMEKERAVFESEKRKYLKELEDEASEAASTFAVRILSGLSGRELHLSAFRKLLGTVDRIAEDARGHAQGEVRMELLSAFPPEEGELAELRGLLESRLPGKADLRVSVDGSLIAGAKLRIDDMVYDSSLRGRIEDLKTRLREKG